MATYNTSMFTWVAADKSFVCEASDFGLHGPLAGPCLERLFPDACDVGFYLVSHKTSKKIAVVFDDQERNNEDELLYTTYRPVDSNHDFKIVVFND